MCCFWPCRMAAPPATSNATPRSPRASSTCPPISACDDPDDYARWYGEPHPAPDWLPRFVYGLPELRREALRGAHYASGVGCNATALNLALWPLAQAGLIAQVSAALSSRLVGRRRGRQRAGRITRCAVVRSAPTAPAGHRHLAEVRMVLPHRRADPLQRDRHRDGARRASAGARGPDRSARPKKTCGSCTARPMATSRSCGWSAARSGCTACPEPRIVAGTNFCDIGFETRPGRRPAPDRGGRARQPGQRRGRERRAMPEPDVRL